VNITEAVAIGAGVPNPKIYVIDSPAPNAFATGRNPEHGTIAVSKGLLEILDRQELEGVVAHEMAHIKNYDILFMTMLAATVGAIVVLSDLITHSWRYGGFGGGRSERRSDRDGGGGQAQAIAYLLLIVLLVLAPILTTLLRLAVSRKREYLADATGAYITRNPEGLARALEKLRDYNGPKLDVSKGVEHLFFTNPVRNLNANAMFATHPPIQERIDRLRRM
jgi:heat shock protein HtpX